MAEDLVSKLFFSLRIIIKPTIQAIAAPEFESESKIRTAAQAFIMVRVHWRAPLAAPLASRQWTRTVNDLNER